MKYYILEPSLDRKIMGFLPQVNDINYNCNINDSRFIGNFLFEKIDITNPILATPILYKKSYLTDFIHVGGIGFTFKLVVSTKLKELIEESNYYGIQFFQISVIHNNILNNNYWLLHPYRFNLEGVDFRNSKLVTRKRNLDKTTYLEVQEINDLKEFNYKINQGEKLSFSKILIKEDKNQDFFPLRYTLSGINFLVTKELRCKIEDDDCSGMEFRPSELSFNDWMVSGGEREKSYGKIY